MGKPGEVVFTHSQTGRPYPYPEMTVKILALGFCDGVMFNEWKLFTRGQFTVWVRNGGVWKVEKSTGALTERRLAEGRGFEALRLALVRLKVVE